MAAKNQFMENIGQLGQAAADLGLIIALENPGDGNPEGTCTDERRVACRDLNVAHCSCAPHALSVGRQHVLAFARPVQTHFPAGLLRRHEMN